MVDFFITIDTEFSLGGSLTGNGSPVTDRAVYCSINGQSHGLGFLLSTFKNQGIKATFFVEAAHTTVLGYEPMRPVVQAILDDGHDVQLHIHPIWLALADKGGFFGDGNYHDSMETVTYEQACRLIEIGCKAFQKWGAPTPVAFRAGNLQMGVEAYKALASFKIPASSSLGIAIHRPSNPLLNLASGTHTIEGVTEVPVLTYTDIKLGPKEHLKNLTITGSGFSESRHIINSALKNGVEDIVLLTHPFEFIKKSDPHYKVMTVNRVNQSRLARLCELISGHADVHCKTFAEKTDTWLVRPQYYDAELKVPFWQVAQRIIENNLNDHIWGY